MKKIASLAAVLWLAAGAALASGGPDLRMQPAPINPLDAESLQRGARTFMNYCMNCHSARYMRYNRLRDIGLTEAQIADNLIFAGRFLPSQGGGSTPVWQPAKIGDTMQPAMRPADGKAWFGATPPDLSLEARVRGVDWLYNYFMAFYRDPASATGWNNLVFPNVGMPHVLWELQGVNTLKTTEFENHEEAQAAAIAAKSLALTAPVAEGKYLVKTLVTDTPGTQDAAQYQRTIADLVNFLDYVAEPAKVSRGRIGIAVLMFLGLLFALAYTLKREYWKDVH